MNSLLISLALLGSTLAASAQQIALPGQLRQATAAPTRYAALPGMGRDDARRTSTTVRVPGRAVHYNWSATGMRWEDATTQTLTYNSKAQLQRQVEADSATADPQTTIINTYDAAGNPTEAIVQQWNGSSWTNAARLTLAYDSHQLMTEQSVQLYANGLWLTISGNRYQNQYDAAGRLVSRTSQKRLGSGAYANEQRSLFTLPASGQAWTASTIQSWTGTAWQDSVRIGSAVWQDFAKDYLLSATYEERQGSTWQPGRFVGTYTPTAERRIVQRQVGTTYVNDTQQARDIDAAGNQTSFREEQWNTVGNAWEVQYEDRTLLTYNASGDIVRRIEQMNKVGDTNGLENQERINYSNFQTIALANRTTLLPANTLQAYPNPSADGRFVLHINLLGGLVQLTINDALGRAVLSQEYPAGLPATLPLDLSQHPAGLYTLEVRTASGVARQRLVVQ